MAGGPATRECVVRHAYVPDSDGPSNAAAPKGAARMHDEGRGTVIEGTVIRPLKKIVDERGYLMEMLRQDWPEFKGFTMSYMSMSYPGVIRAWHGHPRTKQRDTFVVPVGMIKAVVYDEATGEVNEHLLGEENPVLLSFDGSKWHGFKCIGTKPCVLINYPDKIYDYKNPDEARRPYNDPKIPYDWDMVMK